jgi:hypothetical protein
MIEAISLDTPGLGCDNELRSEQVELVVGPRRWSSPRKEVLIASLDRPGETSPNQFSLQAQMLVPDEGIYHNSGSSRGR